MVLEAGGANLTSLEESKGPVSAVSSVPEMQPPGKPKGGTIRKRSSAGTTSPGSKRPRSAGLDSIPLRSRSESSVTNAGSIRSYFPPRNGMSILSFSAEDSTSTSGSASFNSASVIEGSSQDSFVDDFPELLDAAAPWPGEPGPVNDHKGDQELSVARLSIEPQTCDERLKHIWRNLSILDFLSSPLVSRFPTNAFTDAPLIVVWEIARIALHCGVDLSTCAIDYDNPQEWIDQYRLRSTLAQVDQFRDKIFPQENSPDAWKLGLSTFQTRDVAVNMQAELQLNAAAEGPLYFVKLLPLAFSKRQDRSHRLMRRFGGDRFMEVVIPCPTTQFRNEGRSTDTSIADKVIRWLVTKQHYFLGRRWAAFSVRDAKKSKSKTKGLSSPPKILPHYRVFFFACDGDTFRMCTDGVLPPPEDAIDLGKRSKVKRACLLDWAIGDLQTSEQPIFKLFSRISLSLTRTFPGCTLETHQIHNIAKDLGGESVMNDGIGRMSYGMAKQIAEALGLDDVPSAYQGRIGSAKGVWIRESCGHSERPEELWIETYPSQRKSECDFTDIQHRTFEVKDWDTERKSASLNQQFIPVLEAQAINPAAMRQTIACHLHKSIREDLEADRAATKHPTSLRQWLHRRKPLTKSSCTQFLGGLPKDQGDTIAFLLDSGFDHSSSKYLQDICWSAAKARTDTLQMKLNIRVPRSTYAFMVADFSGTLEEDEVHMSFSTKFQTTDGFSEVLLEEIDILVARAPTHLPSDIQRIKVVSRHQLRHLKDVIVFSTKGSTPLADKLSGGDYDGDKAWICWDQDIVENFRNAAPPPVKDLSAYLPKLDLKMSHLRQNECNDDIATEFLYQSFCFNMRPSLLGSCTSYKEAYCYEKGNVKSDTVISLSQLLGCLVDEKKQGYLFTESNWKRFRKEVVKSLDSPLEPEYTKDKPGRRITEQSHILDFLKFGVAVPAIESYLVDLFNAWNENTHATYFDQDLTKILRFYQESHGDWWNEVEKQLKMDIKAVSELWAEQVHASQFDVVAGSGSAYVANVTHVYQIWKDIKPPRHLIDSLPVQMLLEGWNQDRNSTLWQLLKASLTFQAYYQVRPGFVWQIAGRQLAILKSKANPTVGTAPVTVQPEMWNALRPDKKFIEAAQARREAATATNEVERREVLDCGINDFYDEYEYEDYDEF